jgi:hypothetical protein
MEQKIMCEICQGKGCEQCEGKGDFIVEIFDEPIEVIE